MNTASDEDVPPILRPIKPAGWAGAFGLGLLGLPIWGFQASKSLFEYFTKGPAEMFRMKDRSSLVLPDPLPGLTREMVDVGGGLRIHAVSPGRKPDKPLMLMVHGFPECWYSWRHQMAAFKDDYDVVAIDMRGYNDSDKPQGIEQYTLDKVVADIPALVKALGHTSCVLVAHDWGGIIAWYAAAMYPKVVDQLIIMAAPHMGLAGVNMTLPQLQKSWYILMFQVPVLPEQWLLNYDCRGISGAFKYGPFGVRNPDMITDTDIEWFKQAMSKPGAATASINYYRALMRHNTISPIGSIWEAAQRRVRMPVLLLWADKDAALGEPLIRNIEQVVPDVEVQVLKDCSHWIQQDQPQKVNSLMRAFLDKAQSQPKARL